MYVCIALAMYFFNDDRNVSDVLASYVANSIRISSFQVYEVI